MLAKENVDVALPFLLSLIRKLLEGVYTVAS